MNLNKSQKKFIKKNLRKLSLAEVARKIGLQEHELIEYLKSSLDEDKLEKIVYQKAEQANPLSQNNISILNFSSWIKRNYLALIFLILLAFGVYANSLKNEFLSDDIAGIMQEKNIANPFYFLTHQTVNFFRYLVYGISYHLGGLTPIAFRLGNVILHIGSVLLIFAIISILNGPGLALLTAGLFAVHPILIEGVAWISGGIHSQYTFFDLLSLLFYILARSKNWDKKLLLVSLSCFLIALFTTEKSVVLPLILVVFEFSFGRLNKNWKKLVPYFLLGGFCAIFVILGGNFSSRVSALRSQYYQEGGLYNPLTQIPIALSSYLELMAWPSGLTLYHSEMAFSYSQYIFRFAITALFFGAIAYTFFAKKKQYFFWLTFFFISLLPMLTPFKVAWIVAERYAYFGAIGIFIIFCIGLQKIGEVLKNKYITYLIWGLIIIALSVKTITRNVDWKNQDNLWLAAAKTSPSSPQNHNNLGDLYARHGNLEKAAEEFQYATKLKPDYGDAYHNLANVYRQMGKNDLAAENYQKAITFNPNLWQSYQNLGVILYEKGQIANSIKLIQKAIEINPENSDLHMVLGYIYLQSGNKVGATQEFEICLQINPNNQKAQEFLLQLKQPSK